MRTPHRRDQLTLTRWDVGEHRLITIALAIRENIRNSSPMRSESAFLFGATVRQPVNRRIANPPQVANLPHGYNQAGMLDAGIRA
jgi:hypothetical protein